MHMCLGTHTQKYIFIAFPWQQWLCERASVLHYTYTASHLKMTIGGGNRDAMAFLRAMRVTIVCHRLQHINRRKCEVKHTDITIITILKVPRPTSLYL
jgi:hypothetical protein